jgi:uncharacterized membrane protein
MRSLKKIFWSGLVFLIAICLIYNLFLLLYNFLKPFLKPLKELLFVVTKHHIPGLELVAFIIVVLIFGLIALYLSSLPSSKIPFISQIIGFSKIALDLSNQISKGEGKNVLVEIAPGVYRPGYTRNETLKIDDRELIKVFLPNTPNFTTGQTRLVVREELIYLSKELNKPMLKTITSGGLLK